MATRKATHAAKPTVHATKAKPKGRVVAPGGRKDVKLGEAGREQITPQPIRPHTLPPLIDRTPKSGKTTHSGQAGGANPARHVPTPGTKSKAAAARPRLR